MALALRDDNRHTYGDYRRWPDDVRYELIDGQAYAMSPGPNRRHQEVVGELFRQVADALEGAPCRVYVARLDIRRRVATRPTTTSTPSSSPTSA